MCVWGWVCFGSSTFASTVGLLPVVDLCLGKKPWIMSELGDRGCWSTEVVWTHMGCVSQLLVGSWVYSS